VACVRDGRRRQYDKLAGLPSNYIDARPHGPLEQLEGGGFANTAGAADEDGDKVLDAVAL